MVDITQTEKWRTIERIILIKSRCMFMLTNSDIRDDFAQVGRIRAWEILSRNPNATKTGVGYCAYNAMKDESRKEKVRNHVPLDSTQGLDRMDADGDTWMTWLDAITQWRTDLQWNMPEAFILLQQMAPKIAGVEVIWASFLYNDQDEAARALGLSVAAFKSRLHRAQTRARQLCQ